MPKIKETLRAICFYKIDSPPQADLAYFLNYHSNL